MTEYVLEAKVSSEAEAGLRAYRKRERDAYNASDLAMVDNFCEDVILSSNGVPNLKGREEIRNFFATLWKSNHAAMEMVVDESVVELDGFLIITGRFVLKITSKATLEANYEKGRMLVVLKKNANGDYELFREAALDNGPEQL